MKPPKLCSITLLILAAFFSLAFVTTIYAQQAPLVKTDKPIYTLRDKAVTISGSNFLPNVTYYVWLQKPAENATKYTGKSFFSRDGSMPPIFIEITAKDPFGTYKVSISNSSTVDISLATAHYGIWGTSKPAYQRTEGLTIKGGGIWPGGFVRFFIINAQGNLFALAVASDPNGEFNATWKIPPTVPVGRYLIFMEATGSRDDPNLRVVSFEEFTVTTALLDIQIAEQPKKSYQRTDEVIFKISTRYPDGSPVVTVKEGLRPVGLYIGERKIVELPVRLSEAPGGIWEAKYKIPVNISLSKEYNFRVVARAFDDGNGNIGGARDLISESFEVTAAKLLIELSVTPNQPQVAFDAIEVLVKASYPDRSVPEAASIKGAIVYGDRVYNLAFTYDAGKGAWSASYGLSVNDVLRLGEWMVRVEAEDPFLNKGEASISIRVRADRLIIASTVTILTLLAAGWLIYNLRRAIRRAIALAFRRRKEL